jgi:hypothetical protein
MSRFFDSEQVRESLFELDELQHKLFNELMEIPFSDSDKKREHLETMKQFLEKQKVFIFRMSLSDDPDAIEMKNRILDSAVMFGLEPGDNINTFFTRMEESIEKLENTLDD